MSNHVKVMKLHKGLAGKASKLLVQLGVCAVALAAGLTLPSVFGVRQANNSSGRAPTSTVDSFGLHTGSSSSFGLMPKRPLLEGRRVSAATALARVVRACDECLRLPVRGKASVTHVDAAYVDGFGGVALVYDDGTWVVLTPDARSNQSYMEDMAPILASEEWPFEAMGLRTGKAAGTDANVHGPAALLWVEGGYLWEVIGKGGSDLQALLNLAESL